MSVAMNSRACRVVIAASMAASICLTSVVYARPTADPDLDGRLLGVPESFVAIKFNDHPDRPDELGFQAEGVPEKCSDGSAQIVDYSVVKPKYLSARRFRYRSRGTDSDNGNKFKYIVRGRLSRDRERAHGTLLSLSDYADPPVGGFPDFPDCATDGKLAWKVSRAR